MKIRIIASRHTAFYSPLISTMAAGFLDKHGLEYTYGVLPPGETAAGMIRAGATDIMQSAPSTNWAKMEKGETGFPMHFALINRRDGFFLARKGPIAAHDPTKQSPGRKPRSRLRFAGDYLETGRNKDAAFAWKDLEGRALIADHGSQPLAMLRYAVHYNGVDWSRIAAIDAGTPEKMVAAFREERGDYIHLQAPAPQLLEEEGFGWIAASVGASMPPNAFSSLCASREFIASDACRAFVKAFAEAKAWVNAASADEIAATEAPHFPGVSEKVLASAIARYKEIGAWEGGPEIPRDLYEQSLNVFETVGAIKQRQPYDAVCVQV